ncbi:hypothetical protein N9937_01590 [bacterium]|nr:hypothetical protein [bacterium]
MKRYALISALITLMIGAVFVNADTVALKELSGQLAATLNVWVGTQQAETFVSTNYLCEADFMDDAHQEFAGGIYESITNFEVNVCHAMFTATDSNATITVDGWYELEMTLSAESMSGAIASIEVYLYADGAQILTPSGNKVGWDSSVPNLEPRFNVAFTKTLYLTAGTVISWRLETGGAETIQWDHGTVRIKRV